MNDIHYLMSQALEDRGHSFEICWSPESGGPEFVLSVEANARGGDANWKMFRGLSREAKPLWTYISCDVLLVFNLVKSTAGDDMKAERMSQSNTQGQSAIATLVRRDVTSQQAAGADPGAGKKAQALAGDLSLVQIPT